MQMDPNICCADVAEPKPRRFVAKPNYYRTADYRTVQRRIYDFVLEPSGACAYRDPRPGCSNDIAEG